jgi:hypothetical protein
MTSHYRHRRDGSPAAVAPTLEKGEVYVNTANRQMAVGNVADGQPLFLIAVRYFDTRSQYAAGDFVANAGKLYVAQANISPGAFNPAQWFAATRDPGDSTDLSSYLPKAGGTMTGPLVLAGAPSTDLEAATRKYVDDSTPPPPNAALIPSTATGAIAATNVQDAIAELEAEKVAKAGGTMTGHLSLPTVPAAANAVRKDYVDAGDSTNATALAGKVSKTGDTMTGDLKVAADTYSYRGANVGYVFLGSNQAHYVGFDGTNYIMPSGGLGVGGGITAGAGTFSGLLAANGGSTHPSNVNHTFYNNGVYFASATPSSVMVQGPPYPTIAFHCQGYFGANFGMNTDGNFYMGGWSHGEGVAYRFWTTRDFSNNPGNPLINARWVYLGDVDCGFNGPLQEPWGGAGITGISGPSSYNAFTARFRQFQIQVADGTWVATGYA